MGMKPNLTEFNIRRKGVEYLGHLVNHEGIQMIPSYIDLTMDWLNKLKNDHLVLRTDAPKIKFNWLKEVFRAKPVRGYSRYDKDEPYTLKP